MAKANDKKAAQRAVTPKFRVSFPHVFKAQAMDEDSKKKFSVTALFKKTDDLSGIKKILTAAKVAEFGPNKADWPKNLESPIRDGDDSDFAEREGYAGHWVMKFSTSEDRRPGVLSSEKGDDGKWVPIEDPSEFYAGCYARAYIYAYVWTFGKKKGVGLILDYVQKLADGKSFSSKKAADQVFAPLDDEEDTGSDEDSETEDTDDSDF